MTKYGVAFNCEIFVEAKNRREARKEAAEMAKRGITMPASCIKYIWDQDLDDQECEEWRKRKEQ
jgi:quinol monooxygenase YgiN